MKIATTLLYIFSDKRNHVLLHKTWQEVQQKENRESNAGGLLNHSVEIEISNPRFVGMSFWLCKYVTLDKSFPLCGLLSATK